MDKSQRAITLAFALHGDQKRKASIIPGAPYISHLMEVAGMVAANGGDDETVAAALLHDAIEDQGAETRDAILEQCGPRVLALVEECTEAGTGGATKAPLEGAQRIVPCPYRRSFARSPAHQCGGQVTVRPRTQEAGAQARGRRL